MLKIQYHQRQHREPKTKIIKKDKISIFCYAVKIPFQISKNGNGKRKLTPPHIPVWPDVLRDPRSHGSKCFT